MAAHHTVADLLARLLGPPFLQLLLDLLNFRSPGPECAALEVVAERAPPEFLLQVLGVLGQHAPLLGQPPSPRLFQLMLFLLLRVLQTLGPVPASRREAGDVH